MSIISDVTGSFYSTPFYSHVMQVRRGIGMKFILILTLVAVLLVTGYLLFYSASLNKIAAEVPEFASSLPEATIKDGKFSIDKPSPYNIAIGTGADRKWLSIDTNYKMGDAKAVREFMEKNNIIMLITADEFVTFKNNDSSTLEINSFHDMKDMTIARKDWMGLAGIIMEKGVQFLIIFVFFTLLVFLFFYNLFAVFLWAIVMMVIGYMLGIALEFGAAMRLTAAARMPCVAIVCAPMMFGGHFITGLVSWIIWFAYLFYALTATRRGAKA